LLSVFFHTILVHLLFQFSHLSPLSSHTSTFWSIYGLLSVFFHTIRYQCSLGFVFGPVYTVECFLPVCEVSTHFFIHVQSSFWHSQHPSCICSSSSNPNWSSSMSSVFFSVFLLSFLPTMFHLWCGNYCIKFVYMK
jgi:hypothetical protein